MVQGKKQPTRTERGINEGKKIEAGHEFLLMDLQKSLSEVTTHGGLVPICSHCRKIRDNNGLWRQVEAFAQPRTDTHFTHGICPDCARQFYPNHHLTR